MYVLTNYLLKWSVIFGIIIYIKVKKLQIFEAN